MENFKKFISTKVFLRHLAMISGAFLIFILIVALLINSYTDHGETVTVPDFKGLKIKDIDSLIENYDLSYKIIDSVFDDKSEPGTVVSQIPISDFKVKSGRCIYLTTNSVMPKQISLTKNFLKDLSLRQALARLETYGLKCERMKYEPGFARDAVIRVEYKGKEVFEGQKLIKGTGVTLVLDQGQSEDYLNLPNLFGKSLDSAVYIIQSAGLSLALVKGDESIVSQQDSLSSWVYSQKPSANSEIRKGSLVDIFITIKNPSEIKIVSDSTQDKNMLK